MQHFNKAKSSASPHLISQKCLASSAQVSYMGSPSSVGTSSCHGRRAHNLLTSFGDPDHDIFVPARRFNRSIHDYFICHESGSTVRPAHLFVRRQRKLR